MRNTIGAFAMPRDLWFVKTLPKTRSGKVMRRVLKALTEDSKLGDLSTIEDGVTGALVPATGDLQIGMENAWPQGFVGGQLDACPSGLSRHANGGGCALASVPDSVYVGPFAQVLGGDVSGTARIEDHATILSGRVTGGTVGGLSVVSGVGGTLSSMMTVGGAARLETSFYPVGIFEPFQSITGSARLYGDVELRGARLTVSSGNYTGFVDGTSPSQSITEVTTPPPYAWRR